MILFNCVIQGLYRRISTSIHFFVGIVQIKSPLEDFYGNVFRVSKISGHLECSSGIVEMLHFLTTKVSLQNHFGFPVQNTIPQNEKTVLENSAHQQLNS